jgi:hypothetical protein
MDFGKILGGNPLQMLQQLSGEQIGNVLQAGAGQADDATRASLGQQLLDAFTNHVPFTGTGADAAVHAGTTEEAVQSGTPDAITAIVNYAKGHPEVIQAATTAFVTKNPEVLKQLGPSLLSGLFGNRQQ